MLKYLISLTRSNGFMFTQSIGTDALNALSCIPGIGDLEIISESDERVELSYSGDGSGKFWKRDECLAKHGLAIADDK